MRQHEPGQKNYNILNFQRKLCLWNSVYRDLPRCNETLPICSTSYIFFYVTQRENCETSRSSFIQRKPTKFTTTRNTNILRIYTFDQSPLTDQGRCILTQTYLLCFSLYWPFLWVLQKPSPTRFMPNTTGRSLSFSVRRGTFALAGLRRLDLSVECNNVFYLRRRVCSVYWGTSSGGADIVVLISADWSFPFKYCPYENVPLIFVFLAIPFCSAGIFALCWADWGTPLCDVYIYMYSRVVSADLVFPCSDEEICFL